MKTTLLSLLDQNHFISGEKLAKQLGISRTAVWKQIQNLQKIGYEIESVKNKGYKLISRPDIPLSEEISTGLETKIIGKTIHFFQKIPSTNLYAKELIKNKAEEGTIVISDIQTEGRGRKNRLWSSPEGGLWFSTIMYPDIPPHYGMLLTMASSVAVAKGIEEITGIKPEIKWPNDLLIDGRKVCGILTELDAEMDKVNHMIIGIGINVNNSIDNNLKQTAISLKQKTSQNISRVDLLRSIIRYLDLLYGKVKTKEYKYIRNLWFSYSNIIGKNVEVDLGNDIKLLGIVQDIDEKGSLILKTKEGIKQIVTGDIRYC
jgi:BirA family biotin operon repressor/biotin-[acetyl-CoA-carboxylase] ligase